MGFSSVTGDETIMFANNASFDGTQRNGKMTADGQLWIGSTASPHVKKGIITSPLGTISIGYSSPNITLDLVSISPAKTLTLIDDFIASNVLGQLEWLPLGNPAPIDGTSTHPGLLQLPNGATSEGICLTDSGATLGSFIVGGGSLSLNFVISLVTLSTVADRYKAYFGLYDAVSFSTGIVPVDGIYFSYTDNENSGNWVLNCTSASVTSSVNTAIPAVTGFVNLGITINAAGTSVSYTINGASVGIPIGATIPSVAISPTSLWIPSAGNLPSSLIDLFYLTKILTVSR